MLCAIPSWPMSLEGCEDCSTEDVTPYTVHDLREFALEAEGALDALSEDIQIKVELLRTMLKYLPFKKNGALSVLISGLRADYIDYLSNVYQKAVTETVSAMTTESDGYLLITDAEPASDLELGRAYVYYEDLTRRIDAQYAVLEACCTSSGGEQADCRAVLDNIISLYGELADATARYAALETADDISAQSEKGDLLVRASSKCGRPTSLDSLQDYQSAYMTNFRWVRAWVGVYETDVPDASEKGKHLIGEFIETERVSLEKCLEKARADYPNAGSIQVKYFFLADTYVATIVSLETRQHNVIYEGNISVSAKYGSWWTYNVPLPSTMPKSGLYKFDVNEDWFIVKCACCKPSSSPDDTKYYQWCNKHCGGCFACDAGGDQNFVWAPRRY